MGLSALEKRFEALEGDIVFIEIYHQHYPKIFELVDVVNGINTEGYGSIKYSAYVTLFRSS